MLSLVSGLEQMLSKRCNLSIRRYWEPGFWGSRFGGRVTPPASESPQDGADRGRAGLSAGFGQLTQVCMSAWGIFLWEKVLDSAYPK